MRNFSAHASGVAARDRIAAPRESRALTVPGLGLCIPEQIGEGWLMRPAGTDTRMRITRDATAAPPTVEVVGAEGSWRTPLTSRHAEILQLLHRRPAGSSAAGLSGAIYGDAEHVVTVRAEVSRLRRVLGTVVETRPYRLSNAVDMTVSA